MSWFLKMGYNLLQSMIKQMMEKGYPQSDAERIATKHLQNKGKVQPGTMKLTTVGREESDLDRNTRKRAREAKKRGLPEYYLEVINGKVRIKSEYRKKFRY